MTDLSTLTLAAFTPWVGTAVTLQDAAGDTLAVTLDKAVANPASSPRGAPRTAFSLILSAAGPSPFTSGHCLLSHPGFGTVGPVQVARIIGGSLDQTQAVFQVVFN